MFVCAIMSDRVTLRTCFRAGNLLLLLIRWSPVEMRNDLELFLKLDATVPFQTNGNR